MRIFKFILSILVMFPFVLNATHLIGGELVYTCLGGNQYEIKVIIYRDCGPTNTNGTGFDGSGVISIYNMDNDLVSYLDHGSVFQEYVVDEFTSECLTLPPELCVEKGTYTIITTLPNDGQGYQVVYQRCCRNDQVLNIVNPGDLGSSLVAYIPAISGAACNNSPTFDSFPPMALCLGSDVEISQSATDVDGDSLVYSLVAPFHGSSNMDPTETYPPPYAQVAWETGYSNDYPMDSNPVLGINSSSGVITGTPTQEGYYIIGIKVEEYRNGVYLGEILRDFRFLVVDCEIATAASPVADVYCDGLDVNFTNESINAFDYSWDFGDLTSTTDNSTEVEPFYVYPDSGTYEVTLIANPGTFCSDTAYISFALYPNVFPYFSLPPTDCEEDALYDFEGAGIIPDNGIFSWDFGPNASNQFSSELSPQNINFTTDGAQQISFTVSYLDCEETYEQTLLSSGDDLNSMNSTLYNLCEPQTVTFTANSNSTAPLVYNWDLGNGSSSSLSNPVVEYAPGAYDVSLTVLNTITGCESTLSEEEWITVYPQPLALFDASVFTGCSPLDVTFANLSEDGDNYEWSINGVVQGVNDAFSYVFNEGTYSVNLEVSNDYFCSQDDEMTVEIVAMPVVDADFQLTYECNEDLEISIVDNSDSFTDLQWDFGDGNILTETQNSYIYSFEGIYTVSLTATNPSSCNVVSSASTSITVMQPPLVEFATIPTNDCEAGVLQFQNLTVLSNFDNSASWEWDLGDGTISQSYSEEHIYTEEGVYFVSLDVLTDMGCTGNYGESIDIGFLQKPVSLFSYTIDSCTKELQFVNESVLSDSYLWDLNGEESEEINPTMIIEVGGMYNVSLIASNEFCSEEFNQLIDYNAESVYKHVSVPNVFTPNGDAKNDLMLISGLNDCETVSLKIFNRWGAEVFHTLSPLVEPWAGENHSNEVLEGVYYYLLELEHLSITGDVTIFR